MSSIHFFHRSAFLLTANQLLNAVNCRHRRLFSICSAHRSLILTSFRLENFAKSSKCSSVCLCPFSMFVGRESVKMLTNNCHGQRQRPPLSDFGMEQWAEQMLEHKLREANLNSAAVSDGSECFSFSDLVHWWHSNVFEATLNVHGIRLLVRMALDREQSDKLLDRKKGSVAELWDHVKDTMRASDFLAFLIMELVEREQLEEAKIFAKLLSVRGTSFVRPLRLLTWRTLADDDILAEKFRQNDGREENRTLKQQLNYGQRVVEQLSAVVQECYFDVQQKKAKRARKRSKETNERPMDGDAAEEDEQPQDSKLIASSRYQSLLWVWMPNRVSRSWAESHGGNGTGAWTNGFRGGNNKTRKPHNGSRQMHRVDAKESAKLGQLLVKMWAEIATKGGDVRAWDRLEAYVQHNNLPMDEQLRRRWQLRRTDMPLAF